MGYARSFQAPVRIARSASQSVAPGLWRGCQWLLNTATNDPFSTLVGNDRLSTVAGTPYAREISERGPVIGSTTGGLEGVAKPTEGLTELTLAAYFNLRGYSGANASNAVLGTRLTTGPYIQMVAHTAASNYAQIQYQPDGSPGFVINATTHLPFGWQLWIARVTATKLSLFCSGV
jgi:hypothetical protein